MVKEIFTLGVIVILAKREDRKSVRVMSVDSGFEIVLRCNSFIFVNKLTEITFYSSRFQPVVRSPDNDSCIIVKLNEFWALSAI